jgi:hypothetical protein
MFLNHINARSSMSRDASTPRAAKHILKNAGRVTFDVRNLPFVSDGTRSAPELRCDVRNSAA